MKAYPEEFRRDVTVVARKGETSVALLFVTKQLPETHGATLEQLEEDVTTGSIHVRTPRG